MLFDHEPLLIDYMLRTQHKVDDQHYDMPLIYYMKGHKLHFGRREFSLITDFRFETVSFDLHSSGELKFWNRVFPDKIGFSITNLDIIGVIEEKEIFCKLSDDDAIRLCFLLALEVIFIGSLLTFNVDDTLFSLVENIEAWNSFPWGEHLWCHLYDEIKNLKERHGDGHYNGLFKDRNYVPTYTLSGFMFSFQVLSHERSDRQAKLKFTDEFSSMTSDLCDSLNSMFADLIELADLDEDIGQDTSRVLQSMDTFWLSDDIERFLEQFGQIKCKFSWNDDYIINRNFWLKLVCLDPAMKGWLTEEVQLPVVLERANIFQTNGIDPRKLAHGLSLGVDDPVVISLASREKMSKVTIHEKLKSHGKLALMTFDEIRSWEKEQLVSPLLRTPPLKKRRKDVYGGGCFDVSGSFKGFDCIEEFVSCDDGSLSVKIKDEFENEVILDDVVSSPANLSMLLKRKGKSRVKFTRMRGIIKRSKMVSLRMRVSSNY
nr:phospholipase-like protein [Tanacetum cinerariifolium]